MGSSAVDRRKSSGGMRPVWAMLPRQDQSDRYRQVKWYEVVMRLRQTAF